MLLNNENKLNIVIVGGGVSGLKLACNLGNYRYNKNYYNVTLIDKNLNYIWKPLLHKIIGKSINEFINIIDYNFLSQKNNFKFILGNLSKIDRKNKKILLNNISNSQNIFIENIYINYDILIISIGSNVNDFKIPGSNNCIKLNSLEDSKLCLNKIKNILIKYNIENSYNKSINFVLIGSGPTGIELSTEIINLINIYYKYNIKNLIYKIILIESNNQILKNLPKILSKNIIEKLYNLKINILLNTEIIKIINNGIFTKDKIFIKSNLTILTTGIKIDDNIKNISDLELNNLNQFVVLQNLTTTKDKSIFIMGDCANCKNYIFPNRAQTANQMSDHIFNNIKLIINNKNILDFKYIDKGTLINLSNFGTYGILNINIINKKIFIKGIFAKLLYIYIYRMNHIFIYGVFKTIIIIFIELLFKILYF